MLDEDLERALGHEPAIVPSSGFVSAVMANVRLEAEAPAPIPFPWGRALTGAVLAAITVFVMPFVAFSKGSLIASALPEQSRLALDFMLRLAQNRDMWTIVATLMLTVLLVRLPSRFFVRAH